MGKLIINSKIKYLQWALVAWVSFVFLQSLFFKFQGHEETEIIFGTIAAWMSGVPLFAWAASPFESFGGYLVGGAELIAVILLVIPRTRIAGALLGLCVISGAIFFHLGTPLGVNRIVDDAGNTDGGALFYMACSVWVCCAALLVLSRLTRNSE